MPVDTPPEEGLGLERSGTPAVYFTYDGDPLLSFGGMSDFTFYAGRETYDYVQWADWAEAHGMNHVRAYLPTSWRYIEHFVKENGGDLDTVQFPYEETSPGSRTFDLGRLNEEYWDRFHDQCAYLAEKGIVVHLLLVNGWHISNHIASPDALNWGGHFFNPENNVNAATDHLAENRYGFYFSVANDHSELVAAQKRFLRRAVAETASLGNVYYDLVHELHPNLWLDDRTETWSDLGAWIEEMAGAVRNHWDELVSDRPCLIGQDTSKMSDEHVDWVLSREFLDLAIYGRIHSVDRARSWREEYGKPYIPQESIDDTGDKYSYREPNQRVHIRKYVWKFMFAKCQQIDLYVKERTEGMSPNVGVTQPPGKPHSYDPNGWNQFESDAVVLREFWDALEDYPNLDFAGTVDDGPGDQQYVLSSKTEAIVYCSSPSTEEGVTYPASELRLSSLALADGSYSVDIVDPTDGLVSTRDRRVFNGALSLDIDSWTDDVAVHLH